MKPALHHGRAFCTRNISLPFLFTLEAETAPRFLFVYLRFVSLLVHIPFPSRSCSPFFFSDERTPRRNKELLSQPPPPPTRNLSFLSPKNSKSFFEYILSLRHLADLLSPSKYPLHSLFHEVGRYAHFLLRVKGSLIPSSRHPPPLLVPRLLHLVSTLGITPSDLFIF